MQAFSQPHSPRIVSLSLPRCRRTRGVLLALCASRFPTHFLCHAAPAVPSPQQGSCYGKNPERNAESCWLAVKLLIRNRRYFVLAVQFCTSEQIAAAFDVVCFFQKTSIPHPKGLAGKSNKVNSILVFCGVP